MPRALHGKYALPIDFRAGASAHFRVFRLMSGKGGLGEALKSRARRFTLAGHTNWDTRADRCPTLLPMFLSKDIGTAS